MAWGKPKQSHEIGELLAMQDKDIEKLLKQQKDTGFKNVKELRKAAADGRRPMDGEKGMQALLAGLRGGGTGNKNYQNIPEVDRKHPSLTRKQMEAQKTAEKTALLKAVNVARAAGNRRAEASLHADARRRGLI